MLKKLFITTFLLVLIVFGISFYNKMGRPEKNKRIGSSILSDFKMHELSEVEIQNSSFVKIQGDLDNGWTVSSLNYEADSFKIRKLLLKLLEIKIVDVATAN